MQTNSLLNNPGSGGASDTANPLANGSATSDMFTKLLVAQIRNQDPLSPSDPTQFVQQLAQLSQTEAMQNLATLTSNSNDVLASMQVLSLGAQIGSDVMSRVSQIKLDQTPISGQFDVTGSNTTTTLILTDSAGVDHKLELGASQAGTVPFSVDPVALGLKPDTYQLRVETSSKEAPGIDIAGRLNSVRLSTSGVVLSVSNVGDVAPKDITAFNGKSAKTSSI
jgi:flagellar basal-body rod modification protein FlgD